MADARHLRTPETVTPEQAGWERSGLQVLTLEPGGYNASNAYWTSYDINKLLAGLDRTSRERLLGRVDNLTALYADLSAIYQKNKGHAGIPLA